MKKKTILPKHVNISKVEMMCALPVAKFEMKPKAIVIRLWCLLLMVAIFGGLIYRLLRNFAKKSNRDEIEVQEQQKNSGKVNKKNKKKKQRQKKMSENELCAPPHQKQTEANINRSSVSKKKQMNRSSRSINNSSKTTCMTIS